MTKRAAYYPYRSASAKERFLREYDARAGQWPVPSETVTAETSFGPTFVRVSGKNGAPPLVLLHGGGGNSLQWTPNVQALSEGYRVYAVDNIYDNGRSMNTRPIRSVDDFVDWLDDLFTVLDLGDRVNLMGLSYGGWIAGWCAYRLARRLNRVVLLAPAFTVLPLRAEFIIRAVLCTLPFRYFTRNFLVWLLNDYARSGEEARAMVEDTANFAFMAFRSFRMRKIVKPAMLSDEQLGSIDVPTLFMVGEHDRIYYARDVMERLAKAAPRIRAEIIRDAGHDLTLVKADLVNRKVMDFLGRD